MWSQSLHPDSTDYFLTFKNFPDTKVCKAFGCFPIALPIIGPSGFTMVFGPTTDGFSMVANLGQTMEW